jgi:ATP-dependent Clp protease ATP-binding subunit ClpB
METLKTPKLLDTTNLTSAADVLRVQMQRKLVGQDKAIDACCEVMEIFYAGLNAPNRPVGTLLFLGPTGSGKTRVFEVWAESLFGDTRALFKVDCAEFQHSHEIAKLLGSPPGYLGHRETHPLFTQEALNQWHKDKLQITLILFDEIEKASDALWQLMLGIMDKGSLTLGDNRRVSLQQCVIGMTSNLGAREMQEVLDGGGMGFGLGSPSRTVDSSKMDTIAVESAKRKFSPEFMNRIDKKVVFKTLERHALEQILEIELGMVQQRILQAAGERQFVFSLTDEAKTVLLDNGFDAKYNARNLKREIEVRLVFPLAKLVSTGLVNLGDFIRVDVGKDGKFTFAKAAEGALVPVLLEKYNSMVAQSKVTPITRSKKAGYGSDINPSATPSV